MHVTYWASHISSVFYIMGGSPGDVSDEPVTYEKGKKGCRMSCDDECDDEYDEYYDEYDDEYDHD